MADIIATVLSVTGVVQARDADGNLRTLSDGDSLRQGETIVTGANGRVELLVEPGDVLALGADEQFTLGQELTQATRPDAPDVATDDATVQQILQALEDGTDLGDVLEAPAAGVAGGGDGEGFGFVRIERVGEALESVEFAFPQAALPPIDAEFLDAGTFGLGGEEELVIEPPEPPADEPPADEPPADEPPTEEPPTEEPPTEEPPTEEPPTEEPPPAFCGVKAYAESGNGINAWENTGNLNQFNAELVNVTQGEDANFRFGVGQPSQGSRPDLIENNEGILFELSGPSAEFPSVKVTIHQDEDGGASGKIVFYDSDRKSVGEVTFGPDGSGDFYSPEDVDVAYIYITGTAGNSGGQGGGVAQGSNGGGFSIEITGWYGSDSESGSMPLNLCDVCPDDCDSNVGTNFVEVELMNMNSAAQKPVTDL